MLIPLLRASHGLLWEQGDVALVLGGTGCTSTGPSGCVHTHLQPQLTPRPRLREPSSPPVPQLPLSSSPPDVSMPGSVHPQSHGLEPFGKAFGSRLRHAPPAALLSGFTCVPLRRNVPVLFPRRLPGKDGHDGPHQGQLSQRPQPWCHASHSHNPPSPSPPWAWRVPPGPRGDVALTSGSWGPATTEEG